MIPGDVLLCEIHEMFHRSTNVWKKAEENAEEQETVFTSSNVFFLTAFQARFAGCICYTLWM